MINKDKPTISTFGVKCKADQTFEEPNTWPYCVDKLDCLTPSIDSTVMTYDWTEESGLTPPFEIKYVLNLKKVVTYLAGR